jgi:hypothetical protein
MIPEVMRNAVHVVLDIPLVVGEIRVPPAGSRREQDVEAVLARNEADPRVNRTIGDAINPEWPLEVIQKRAPEDEHLKFQRLAFHRRLLDASTPAHDRGA